MPPSSETPVGDADHVALSRLVTEISLRLDNGRAGTVHELATDDVVFSIAEDPVLGRDALRVWGERFDRARPLPGIRHSLSNPRFLADGPDRASGTVMVTAYYVPAEGAGDIVATTPFAVGEDHDTYVRTREGWRLASRRWELWFSR
ncbi:nuclear transport factor 2 family protein [Streptomyces sp. P6-2-1]|uniref:nuclear transport factor 2 family protein n=1 Tax=Streptomyces sp. P6-2-1 TaxID=3422591 RepID=UPI003D35DE65